MLELQDTALHVGDGSCYLLELNQDCAFRLGTSNVCFRRAAYCHVVFFFSYFLCYYIEITSHCSLFNIVIKLNT